MKIIVCIKQVPDSAARLFVENGLVTWHDAPLIVNPWDEFAIEAALVQKEKYGGDIIVLCIGPESAKDALRYALAMGCNKAVLISEPGLQSYDSLFTASILASAIQKIGDADLVIMGRQAIDTDMGTSAAQVARTLGWPALTLVSSIKIDLVARSIQIERAYDEGRQVLESDLPALISVVKDIGEPRSPSVMSIRNAQKTTIQTWSLTDLELTLFEPTVICVELMESPQQKIITEMITGQSPQEIAEQLVDKILAEKIL